MYYELKDIASIIFVVFTSFGYQVVFHTLRDYCGNDVKMLKNAFFYGSIIPLFLYISWTFVVLSVIYNNDINFYNLIIDGNIDAGILVDKLSKILLKVPVKAGENGKIFGGVSAKEIAELLKSEYKIEIDKKKIDLKETIKTLGVRIVSIKLYEGVIGNLKIDVISK